MPEVPRPRTRSPRKQAEDNGNADKTATTETPDSSDSPRATGRGPARRTAGDAKLAESLRTMYEGVAVLAFTVGFQRQDERLLTLSAELTEPKRAQTVNPSTGEATVIIVDERTGADRLVDAWMTLADRNPRVKTILVKFTEGGAAAEVVALHVGLLMPFLPGIPGFPTNGAGAG